MSKVRPIQLLVDNRRRDSLGVLLIYYWLRDMGHKVILCNKRNWKDKWYAYQPSVLALSMTDGDGRQDMLSHVAKSTKIVLIPQEGAIPVRDFVVNERYTGQLSGGGAFLNGISKVFLWGRQTAEWLLEAGVFSPEQVSVSGSPRFDPYMVPPKRVDARRHHSVGFAHGFGIMNVYHQGSVMELVEDRRNVDENMYYAPGRNVEDLIWYHTACIRTLFDVLERCVRRNIGPLYIRPSPFELVEGYKFLKHKYPGLMVSNDSTIAEWTEKLCCLVTHQSSTGIDALMAAVPTISLNKLLGPRLRDHMNIPIFVDVPALGYYWQPDSLEETVEMLEAAQKGRLTLTPDPEGLRQYLKDFYDWPRNEPSSLTIAKEISTLADSDTGKVQKVRPLPRPYDKEGIPGPLQSAYRRFGHHLPSSFVDFGYIAFDVLNRNFRSFQRYHFYGWHRSDFRSARAIWQSLRNNFPGISRESSASERRYGP